MRPPPLPEHLALAIHDDVTLRAIVIMDEAGLWRGTAQPHVRREGMWLASWRHGLRSYRTLRGSIAFLVRHAGPDLARFIVTPPSLAILGYNMFGDVPVPLDGETPHAWKGIPHGRYRHIRS